MSFVRIILYFIVSTICNCYWFLVCVSRKLISYGVSAENWFPVCVCLQKIDFLFDSARNWFPVWMNDWLQKIDFLSEWVCRKLISYGVSAENWFPVWVSAENWLEIYIICFYATYLFSETIIWNFAFLRTKLFYL